ncbi:MAG: lamin tail domain-containing protein, partial [Candidatus Aenigmarchaeota archaeon]|nr:lamin tail domain-containing protein [Candidatus Aenigmarchaeota archaeon]
PAGTGSNESIGNSTGNATTGSSSSTGGHNATEGNSSAPYPESAAGHLLLSEVYYDTPGSDNDEEWLELYNPTAAAIDIGGWQLRDNNGIFTFPTGTLVEADAYLVVARNATGFTVLFGVPPGLAGLSLSLGNSGDVLRLLDGSNEVDMVAWEGHVAGWEVGASTGTSLQRSPAATDTDTAADWLGNAVPGPGMGSAPSALQPDQTFSITVQPGWNLISLPLQPADAAIANVLGGISYDKAMTYYSSTWQVHEPANPGASTLTSIDAGKGYWIRATASGTLTVTGTAAANLSISLEPGWNLIGYPSLVARDISTGLASIAGQYSSVMTYSAALSAWKTYNPDFAEFSDLTAFEPGKGYWIDMDSSATITFG